MKIRQVEIYRSPIKLKEPFKISLGLLDHALNVIVIIQTDEGISGFGECSPFMTINGESMETCFVVGQYLAKALKGKDPLNIPDCSATMDAVIYGNTSIKSAFDIALYDIASQAANKPLYQFLGGNNQKVLITDYTVSIDEPGKMAADAVKIKENGFRVIKIKLGESKERDLERIRQIRNAIGNEIPFRVDANQGWNKEEAIQTLTALAPYNIQFCEEPIPRWDFMNLPELRKKSHVPIMADESCCDHHDAKRLIDLSACDLFNVKLGKSSGIYKAQKIIQLATQANMNVQMGGFLESRLGFTAAAHLALTSDNVVYCDFDTPMMFVDDPIVGGITYGKNGVVTVPDTLGLGASVDEKYLAGLSKVVIN